MPRWGGHQLRQERAGMESRAGNWDVSEGKWGGWAGVNPARWELGRGDPCSELAPELSGGEQSLKSELKHYLRHERDSSWMDGWKGEGRESPSSLHTSEIEELLVSLLVKWVWKWNNCSTTIFFFFFSAVTENLMLLCWELLCIFEPVTRGRGFYCVPGGVCGHCSQASCPEVKGELLMSSTGCHALFLWKEELKGAGILSFLKDVLPLVAFKNIKTKKCLGLAMLENVELKITKRRIKILSWPELFEMVT